MSCGKPVTGKKSPTTAAGLLAPQDTEPFQAMVEAIKSQSGIAEGLTSMERGKGKPAEVVFARLRKKHEFKAK